ncbi:MAG: hypothetical protein M1835_000678 [Candelina submexicana]|nr:MAG: hypothetical protein M1835_000678 [Candelina submexicana]
MVPRNASPERLKPNTTDKDMGTGMKHFGIEDTPKKSIQANELTEQVQPPSAALSTVPLRPRNRSPYSRSHLRSRSSAGSLNSIPMMRAKSLPGMDGAGRVLYAPTARPASPLQASSYQFGHSRKPSDETLPGYSGQQLRDVDETIMENAELDTSSGRAWPNSPYSSQVSQNPQNPGSNTFPRRWRPTSPLHQSSPLANSGSTPVRPTSAGSSPLLAPTKFNEPYPGYYYSTSFSSNSSMPSTPTSARSRSPSISSLETIPDSPDAEEQAENIARLKAAADAAGGDNTNVVAELKRRSSLDVVGGGKGFSYGSRDKRKRWSVCGAERRENLDLETIWED